MLLRGEKLLQRKKKERWKQQQEEAARESPLGTESSTSDDGRESEKEEDQPQCDCSVGQNCWVIKNWIAHSTVASESLECDSFN